MQLLIKGGHLVDPTSGVDGIGDVLVIDGIIARVTIPSSNDTAVLPPEDRLPPFPSDDPHLQRSGENGSRPSGTPTTLLGRSPVDNDKVDDAGEVQVWDARGLLVVPGLIDLHAHIGPPGFEGREDVTSGGLAALRGGFTSILVYPDGDPPRDKEDAIRAFRALANASTPCRMYPAATLTVGGEGRVLTEVHRLKDAGAYALTDPHPITDTGLFRRALRYATMDGLPVFTPLGEPSLEGEGVMNEGDVAARLGLPGIPPVAETVALARVLLLAEDTGCAVHVGPVTTAKAVEMLREAKRRGIPVTAETTFHHVTLTEEVIDGFTPHTKVFPPLRTEADRRAVVAGLADGTIDALVTDHTPYYHHETAVEWSSAPFGIVGLETAVPLSITHLIQSGQLTWSQWVERVAAAPARILKLSAGSLAPGQRADITLIDPKAVWTVDAERLATRGRNTPFHGMRLQGWVMETLVGGRPTLAGVTAR